MKKITALILAAGESKRMESPKMLLPFRGLTIIEIVIKNVLSSMADRVVVVLGAESEKIRNKVSMYPVTDVYNSDYRNGMLSSVICGINSLQNDNDAVLVLPGDMPGIKPEIIDDIIKSYRKLGKGIVMPVMKGRRGHPVLIDCKLSGEILKLDANEGLRQLAREFPGEVYELEVHDPSILKDIDTREEYLKEINQIQ